MLVGGAWVGLLLGLTLIVGLTYPLPVVGSGLWFDRGREPVSDAPAVSLISGMDFDPARATPLEFLVLDCVLTAGNISPPGQETYWRPERMGPWRVASPTRRLKARHRASFSAKLLVQPTEF
jgi:hypothetical protein